MRFTPKTEQEMQEIGLFPEGVYNFEVIEAKDRISKNGNDMIELKLCITDSRGSERFVFDYLLEQMHFKLYHFAEAAGLLAKYESGEFISSDCLNKKGTLHLIMQAGQPSPQGGNYPAKNSVKDYVVNSAAGLEKLTVAAQPKQEDEFNDEIPF